MMVRVVLNLSEMDVPFFWGKVNKCFVLSLGVTSPGWLVLFTDQQLVIP